MECNICGADNTQRNIYCSDCKHPLSENGVPREFFVNNLLGYPYVNVRNIVEETDSKILYNVYTAIQIFDNFKKYDMDQLAQSISALYRYFLSSGIIIDSSYNLIDNVYKSLQYQLATQLYILISNTSPQSIHDEVYIDEAQNVMQGLINQSTYFTKETKNLNSFFNIPVINIAEDDVIHVWDLKEIERISNNLDNLYINYKRRL